MKEAVEQRIGMRLVRYVAGAVFVVTCSALAASVWMSLATIAVQFGMRLR